MEEMGPNFGSEGALGRRKLYGAKDEGDDLESDRRATGQTWSTRNLLW